MAADETIADATRRFVENGESVAAIAAHHGVSRSTAHNWRHAYDWDVKRKQWLHKIAQALDKGRLDGLECAAREVSALRALTHAQRLDICAEIALAKESGPNCRLAAVKLSAELDPVPESVADDGRPSRLVIVRPGG